MKTKTAKTSFRNAALALVAALALNAPVAALASKQPPAVSPDSLTNSAPKAAAPAPAPKPAVLKPVPAAKPAAPKAAAKPITKPKPVAKIAPPPAPVTAVEPPSLPVVINASPAPVVEPPVTISVAPAAVTPVVTSPVAISPAPVAVAPVASEPPSVIKDSMKDKTVYKFRADGLDLKTALAMFASQNHLNIVPDGDVSGTVTLDVHDLPLEEMMQALLEAGDCSWVEHNGLIRVHNVETRTFIVDYLRLARKGVGNSTATLNSATASGSGSSGGGGSSGGSSGGNSSGSSSSSTVTLNADNSTDFWTELKTELNSMLTDEGRKSFAINKTAGIIEITDRPSVLKKIDHYLNATDTSIHRQVDIEVKIYDVTLNNQFQFGIDWAHVAEAYEGSLGFGAATLPTAIGVSSLKNSTIGSLLGGGSNAFGGALSTLVFSNFNTQAAINALKSQGNVEVLAKPRIRTLNNQTALIKVGQELPFFAQSTINSQSAGGNQTSSGDIITTITVGTILSITPEISGDSWISMDISPVLTSLVDTITSPSKTATAPVLDTKQASTLVRVHDGTTVVLGGLIQNEKDANDTKVPVIGDIPLFGKLFTGTYRSKVKKELVIFVTPHIVGASEASIATPNLDFSNEQRGEHHRR